MSPTPPEPEIPRNGLTRSVDFKIPLWGLATAIATIGWALITNHFATQQLVKDVAVLQASVTNGQRQAEERGTVISQQSSAANVDMAELRIRVSNLESSINRMQGLGAAAYSSSSAKANR